MTKKFITLHIINDIPWSNLNRDDTGAPKRTLLGGVERGMLSSQSLKRAARKDYEERTLKLSPEGYEDSYRSRNLTDLVMERVQAISEKSGVEIDLKKLRTKAGKLVRDLTGSKEGKETITWLSFEEIETLASVIADDSALAELEKAKNNSESFRTFMKDRGVTGSLAIAAFGRMFASATPFQTEAAISVSPAISSHGTVVEADYFIAADDYLAQSEDNIAGAGAAHLGVALYTSGVFYRTITIDVEELWFNWSGRDSEHAEVLLEQFLTSLIYTLPSGKKNSTAPYSEPVLVIAEEQNYRQAYSISAPITEPDESGFIRKTVDSIIKQFKKSRTISPTHYGRASISGSMINSPNEQTTLQDVIRNVISWMEELKPELEVNQSEAFTEISENVEEFKTDLGSNLTESSF